MPVLIVLLLAAVALVALARVARSASSGDAALPPRAVAFAAAAIIGGIALGGGGPGGGGLTVAASALERTPNPTGVASTKGPDPNASPGVDDTFMRVAADTIPQDARILVVCAADPCDPTLRYWITTRLAPRPPTERYRDADWIIFQGVEPATSSLRAMTLRNVKQVGPGMVLARPGARG